MLVRDRMTQTPVTATPDTSFNEALRLMRERRVRRLPIVERDGRVVGIVSEKDLLNAAPSPATTLSRYEINELLSRLRLRDLMTHQVITVTPDMPLEEAARIMADNKIGGLPVVDAQQQLVGIITETDIFRTMVEMLGARRPGLRLTLRVDDHRGALAQIAGEITRQGGNIITVGVFQDQEHAQPIVTLKVENVDDAHLIEALRGMQIEILDARHS
ncbi:CBS and ACT domain-containing protein [Kallotenue papyrolyticum]|uniref:CBS and ACT domain-containing protein n=1 Tax=Kallotenue papyrolyticum TaxID=1325125 RepID=UPI0004785F5D|nr:CBS and ACT domain-containing protein [Kallotenue papyrolyticum]